MAQWISCLLYMCVALLNAAVCGLQISSSGPGSLEKASGETASLDCGFTLSAQDTGPLDIEWSLQPSDNQREEKVIILYSGDRVYEDYYPPLKGRVHFNAPDPKKGDASITLMGLIATDTGTYQCKVKKVPGLDSKKVLLTVMVRPSRPRCTIEGSPYVGNEVVLRCKADGTNPLLYSWEKTSDSKLLPANAVLDANAGTVKIRNATAAVSGSYRCTAQNRVGAEQCVLELRITTPPNTAGVVAGSVIGVLLFLLLLALLLFCCCRSRQRKKYEKEISYEIREDVPAPKSRVSTARSFTSVGSQRSSLGSMSPSNLHEFAKSQYDKIPCEEYEAPPSHVPDPPHGHTPDPPRVPPARLAGPNLSRMGAVPVMTPAQNRDGSIV